MWLKKKKKRACTQDFLCVYIFTWMKTQIKTEVFLLRKEIIQTSEHVYKIILSLVNNIPHHFMLPVATASLTDAVHPEFQNRQLLKKKYKRNS